MFSKRDLLVTKSEVGVKVSDIVCVSNEFPFTENSLVPKIKPTDSNQSASIVDVATKLSNLSDKLEPELFELNENILFESETSDDDEPNVDLPPANEAEIQLENEDDLQFEFFD
ncbi:hypothetical protein SOPP22_00865 [Shewanella sp. OPT22]|nr:hypothetical protein SOPP22_00865 [Shewanella sp. OPT22]